MDVVVVVSVFSAVAITPRVLARRSDQVGAGGRSVFSPAVGLALVTGLIYVNQVLFTVYVLRVHDGNPSFVARYLPAGWFDLASRNPALLHLAGHFPAPDLLAPSVLRVQAFLELPFVLLAFATVMRWLDAELYRRIARSAVLPLASTSYTAVFCLVEWDLRNPYTADDLVVRSVSAVLTPIVLALCAARDRATTRTPASVSGLLAFIASLGAWGVLVLVVYDTALLYSLGRLPERLPFALAAAVLLLGLRRVASLLEGRPARGGLTLAFLRHLLRYWLSLFFVPALAVRYGVLFGTPQLAAGAGLVTAATACTLAARDVLAEARKTADLGVVPSEGRPAPGLLLARRLGCACLAGTGAACLAAWLTPRSYYEVTLLSETAAFLVATVAVCGFADARSATRSPGADEVSP
ncbi:hypothetical protein ACH5AL_37675 [Actinacidiphila glaucinigra]|uniref:hypothetical protein n=1 Tax=Actinacidiphila glaucinigra TaxID=235986 RepID=UPI0037937258